ncbi:MAG: type II toxin-antitoxin system RelE/ParE family toxin [Limisphaerales bacterium]
MKYTVRPRAWLDIEEIMTYLRDEADEEVAARFWRRAQDTFVFLTQQPGVGRRRSDLRPEGLRSWQVHEFENWLIFYGASEAGIEIFRVRHGMMDLTSLEMRS